MYDTEAVVRDNAKLGLRNAELLFCLSEAIEYIEEHCEPLPMTLIGPWKMAVQKARGK